jgi:hypothetical protein
LASGRTSSENDIKRTEAAEAFDLEIERMGSQIIKDDSVCRSLSYLSYANSCFLWLTNVWTKIPVPEFIDPVFTKTSPKRSFSLNRKRAFWLVFAKTGSIISGTELIFKIGN